ncbi:MAG: glycosyltransferase [Acetobacteraceae bacterium]|nr:glycosyltransferase [Acetobacteraceae bacterium]
MNFLFVHRNFPAQYLHITRNLRDERHRVVFITLPNSNQLRGVEKLEYTFDAPLNEATFPGAREYEQALRRADAVATAARRLKDTGFTPDIIIGHHGWGELLDLGDVWAGVPLLGYFEFYYYPEGNEVGFDPEFATGPETRPYVRARNAINLLALTNPGWGQTPTEFQLATYPARFHDKLILLREGVDLDACAPDPAARTAPLDFSAMPLDPALRSAVGTPMLGATDRLVTYINRSLEPCRGMHILMRALPKLLARRDVHVAIVGAEGDGYGPKLPGGKSWKQHFIEGMRGRYDESRVHFLGLVGYDDYRRLLRRSDAHVYLSYPFVASWSLREALASGCAVIGSDTPPVREFIQHQRNGLLTPFFEPATLAERILALFDDSWLDGHIRTGARAFAERHLSMAHYLARYRAIIANLTATGEARPVAPRGVDPG